MKLRVGFTLLMAFTTFTSSVSLAQAQWGYGLYGGMQACAGMSPAAGASDEDDEKSELIQDRADLRREKREIERQNRQLERDLDTLRESITDVVKPNWANTILEHMDKGMNCQVCGATRPVTVAPPPPPTSPAPPARDTSTTITVVEDRPQVPLQPQPSVETREGATAYPVREPGPIETRPLPPLEDEEPPVVIQVPQTPQRPATPPKPVGRPNKGASIAAPSQGRMPASETVAARGQLTGAPPSEASFGDDFGADIGGADFGSGSPTLCNPAQKPYTMNAWRAICRDNGKIGAMVCTNRYFQNGEVKPAQANSCGRSLERYRRLVVEMEKSQSRLAKIDDEIDKIGYQLRDIKMAERSNRDLEADCPSGKCYERGSTRERKSRGPSVGQSLLALGATLLPAVIGGYVGYKTATTLGKQANEFNRDTGNQAVPLSPYVATGVMSGIASGLSYPFAAGGFYGGAYGGMNGGMGCSPGIGGMGTMGPMGMMSPMGMYGQMGGAFGNPYGQMYPQFGGGMYMPGAGGWGMNGPWGVGSWPGGYPGYGMAGSLVGGIAGGFAGGYAGMAGMAGMGYPGMMAGGFAGGLAGGFAGMAGMAGYPGMVGMAGMAGGLAGGFASSYAGIPGYAGMAGGLAGGFATGYAGGFAGYPGMAGMTGMAGMAGMVGGFATGYAGGYGQQDIYLMQRQAEAQASRARLYQSFLQEYSSFQQKWNTYFGSMGIYGTGGTTDYYTSPTVINGGGSGPTTGTSTGRTR